MGYYNLEFWHTYIIDDIKTIDFIDSYYNEFDDELYNEILDKLKKINTNIDFKIINNDIYYYSDFYEKWEQLEFDIDEIASCENKIEIEKVKTNLFIEAAQQFKEHTQDLGFELTQQFYDMLINLNSNHDCYKFINLLDCESCGLSRDINVEFYDAFLDVFSKKENLYGRRDYVRIDDLQHFIDYLFIDFMNYNFNCSYEF